MKINCDLGMFSCFRQSMPKGSIVGITRHVANHVGIVRSRVKEAKFMSMYLVLWPYSISLLTYIHKPIQLTMLLAQV